VLFSRKGAAMAETGRSSGKVKNPNADPRQKHSSHSPHSPRQNPGDGEPGNVGKGGKDIPVNDLLSSNAKTTTSGAAIARWHASFRPTSASLFSGVAAGGFDSRCSSLCCRRSPHARLQAPAHELVPRQRPREYRNPPTIWISCCHVLPPDVVL
jgi:hypothetical protein